MIPWKSYTVPKNGRSMEKHARILFDYDSLF